VTDDLKNLNVEQQEQDEEDEEMEENSDDEESDDEQNNSDQDQEMLDTNGIIQVDLEARTPVDSDHQIIQHFLEQNFPTTLNLSELSKQLISQQSVGSVLFQAIDPQEPTIGDNQESDNEDDDDGPVLGVCSIFSLVENQEKPLVSKLMTYLKEKCANNSQALKILSEKHCGLFINERYVNIPSDVAEPSIRTLLDEIKLIVEKNSTVTTNDKLAKQQKRLMDQYSFDYWILHSKLKVNHNLNETINETVYLNDEEEIFEKCADTHVDHSFDQQQQQKESKKKKGKSKDEWIPMRRIMFVPVTQLEQIIKQIHQRVKQ